MRKLTRILILALLPVSGVWAAGGNVHLEHAAIDRSDTASLQRGAKYFVNYCLSCHSAGYHRYNRIGEDLGLTDDQVVDNLIFTTDANGERTKVGSLMTVTMTPEYAAQTLGAAPPNLTLVARSRGVDWLYTYLKTFYLDDSRPLGVNNLVFDKVGMPHVLWELQGWQQPVYGTRKNVAGEEEQFIESLELVSPGAMSAEEYDAMVLDLVNFMDYLGEPAKMTRISMGKWVIGFLVILLILVIMLKKEYWRDVH